MTCSGFTASRTSCVLYAGHYGRHRDAAPGSGAGGYETPSEQYEEKCSSCGKRRPLVELTLPDGAGTFRMCTTCAADHIREVGADRITNLRMCERCGHGAHGIRCEWRDIICTCSLVTP